MAAGVRTSGRDGDALARRVHHPGLDGLRAIAVVAVLWFHTGAEGAPGGFLGVSLFFTLSGFLITGLLLDEIDATGTVALRAFWGRRTRRLMPAALACLALVLIVTGWWVAPGPRAGVRADVVSAAADVANWRFVTAHQSYAELFARQPSPVLHFWSLAIEEQFYLAFPLLVLLLAKVRRRAAVPLGLGALAIMSLVAGLLTDDHDLVYYGTHTRAAELLVGGLLAWAWRRHPIARERLDSSRVVQLAAGLGAVAFVALVVGVSQGDGWLYAGGLPALSLLWCVLIVGACGTGGFQRSVAHPVLVGIGARSYGIYLYHWPVFTLVTPDRLHVHGWPARAVQLAIVAGMTELSYRALEQPIRRRRAIVGAVRAPAIALGCLAAVVLGATVVPAPGPAGSGETFAMTDAPDEVVRFDAAAPAPREPERTTSTTADTGDPTVPDVTAAGAGVRTEAAATTTEPPSPAALVTIVGSQPAASRMLGELADDVRLVDRTVAGCAVIAATADLLGEGRCVPAFGIRRPDVIVVTIGAVEHAEVASALATPPGTSSVEVYTRAQAVQRAGVDTFERLGRLAATVVVVDVTAGSRATADVLDEVVEEAVLSTPSLRRATVDDVAGVVRAAVEHVGRPAAPAADAAAPLRALVIGDSTSYGVAKGLAESTVAAFDVEWAGRRNCPIARMESIRWLTGDEFSMADCPSVTSVWPEEIAAFRPDVIVVVVGLPEQSEQRYPGDPGWHVAGDPAFAAVHDADFAALLALARGVGAEVVLATQPPNPSTGTVGWARPELVAGWNAQLAAWDAMHTDVRTIDYGQLVVAAELAAGHSLRPDGLHLDEATVASVVGDQMAPLLRELVAD